MSSREKMQEQKETSIMSKKAVQKIKTQTFWKDKTMETVKEQWQWGTGGMAAVQRISRAVKWQCMMHNDGLMSFHMVKIYRRYNT